jgi:hypothetical protein
VRDGGSGGGDGGNHKLQRLKEKEERMSSACFVWLHVGWILKNKK